MTASDPKSMEQTKTLAVGGGLELQYRIRRRGDTSRGLIVLLHGVASNLTRWSEFVGRTALKDSWDLIRINLRGHGEPPWRGRLDMETWCDDLLRLLDHERCPRTYFIGHSLGAQIAVYFAHWHPSRTAGLVLIDPVLGGALLGHLRLASRFAFILRAVVAAVRIFNRLGIYRRHIPSRDLHVLDEKMREEYLDHGRVEEMVNSYSSPIPDLKHFPVASFFQEILQMARPLPDVAGIAAPVLVVLSNAPTYTDPLATRDAITRFRRAETVTIDAYHWPLTEKPDHTRQAVEDWFANLDQG